MINQRKRKKDIARFLEPAIIITLLTSVLYIFGHSYYNSYFDVLGIDHTAVNLPLSFYLMESFPVVMLLVLVFGLGLKDIDKPTKNFFVALRKNLPFIIVIFTVFYASYITWPSLAARLFLICGMMLIPIVLIFCIKKISMVRMIMHIILRDYKFPMQLAFVAILILMSIFLASLYGIKKAKELSLGVNAKYIEFLPKPELSDIEGKQYIYVLHVDNKYYVIENQQPPPKNPRLIVIPDREIIKAEIYRKDSENKSVTEDSLHQD